MSKKELVMTARQAGELIGFANRLSLAGYQERREFLRMITDPGLDLARIREIFFVMLNKESFIVQVKERETFSGFLDFGAYNEIDNGFTEERFPIRRSSPGQREIVVVSLEGKKSIDEAIDAVSVYGLTRPTYEDCLRFGAQHPRVQKCAPVVFPHMPVFVPGRGDSVLCLAARVRVRSLNLRSPGVTWDEDCRFAFVREVGKG